MTKLVELIQKISLSLLESQKPMAIQFGTVESDVGEPLLVRLSQKIILGEEFLIKTNADAYNRGDKLVLLRDHGGQRFLIAGKKV